MSRLARLQNRSATISTDLPLPAVCQGGIGVVLAALRRTSQWRSTTNDARYRGSGNRDAAVSVLAAEHRYQADPNSTYYTAPNILYACGWHNVSDSERAGDVVHVVALDQNGQQAAATVGLRTEQSCRIDAGMTRRK
jgi:hypothetical protein